MKYLNWITGVILAVLLVISACCGYEYIRFHKMPAEVFAETKKKIWKTESAAKTFDVAGSKETIYFWYTDDKLTSFINSKAVEYGERTGTRVIPVLTGEGEYLEAVNQASLHSDQVPDLYLIGSDSLEKAYLGGLAVDVKDEEGRLTKEKFPESALCAVTYHDREIAYPFYFDTSVLLFNQTYLELWEEQQEDKALVEEYLSTGVPKTLDDLLGIADSFDVPEGVEGIMKWDVTDLLYNYWIVGGYLIMGGKAGDDESKIDINNPQTISCLEAYQALNQFFSMETDSVTYESVLQDFIDGKILFTIVSSDAAAKLEEAKESGEFAYDYGMCVIPAVSDELKSASLSATKCIAINGYSGHKALANEFAAYLVDEGAEDLYAKTGKIPSRKDTDSENGPVQIFKDQYEASVSLPKMMETGNFWIQMEVLFTKVWNGENVTELVNRLDEQIAIQISK